MAAKRDADAMDVPGMMQRAVQLGRDIEDILGDVGLQRLSRAAWHEHALQLANGADLAELRAKIEALPYLHRLVGGVATHWVRVGQDRPVNEAVSFADGDTYGPAYAERIVAGITSEQASAVAAVVAAEQMPASAWGHLGHHEQVGRMIAPREAELAVLDESLRHELRVRDLSWEGGRATLRAGDVCAVLDQGAAARPATAVAAAARSGVRDRLLAKAA